MEKGGTNFFAGKKALVMGGLGFIGGNIAHRFVESESDAAVYGVCLDPYGWNFSNINEIKGSIGFVKGNPLGGGMPLWHYLGNRFLMEKFEAKK